LSADGKTIAEGSINSVHSLNLWDVATGKEVIGPQGHSYPIGFVAFAPGRKIVTSGGNSYCDTDLRVWEAATSKPLALVREERELIKRVALAPGGKTAATAQEDGTVRLWELATTKQMTKLESKAGTARWLSFAPDGKTLAVGHCDYTKDYVCKIIVWDITTGKQLLQFRLPGRALDSIAFSPDGKQLASLGAGVRLWDAANGKALAEFPVEGSGVNSHAIVRFSPDGGLLAAPCYPKGFAIWDVPARGFVGFFVGNGEPARSVTFSPDGRLLACGKDDGAVEVWEVLTWTRLGRLQGPAGRVYALDFSTDGQSLVSGHENTTALIWDVRSLWAPSSPAVTALTATQQQALWVQLGNEQSAEAWRAVAGMSQAPRDSLTMLRERLRPARVADGQTVEQLLARLDADDFAVREKATQELAQLGHVVIPALRAVLEGEPSPEAKRRVKSVLKKLEQSKPYQLMSPEVRRTSRAIDVLELIATAEARELLQTLSTGAPEARLTREAKAALQRLERR
jgi:hypothetical protein